MALKNQRKRGGRRLPLWRLFPARAREAEPSDGAPPADRPAGADPRSAARPTIRPTRFGTAWAAAGRRPTSFARNPVRGARWSSGVRGERSIMRPPRRRRWRAQRGSASQRSEKSAEKGRRLPLWRRGSATGSLPKHGIEKSAEKGRSAFTFMALIWRLFPARAREAEPSDGAPPADRPAGADPRSAARPTIRPTRFGTAWAAAGRRPTSFARNPVRGARWSSGVRGERSIMRPPRRRRWRAQRGSASQRSEKSAEKGRRLPLWRRGSATGSLPKHGIEKSAEKGRSAFTFMALISRARAGGGAERRRSASRPTRCRRPTIGCPTHDQTDPLWHRLGGGWPTSNFVCAESGSGRTLELGRSRRTIDHATAAAPALASAARFSQPKVIRGNTATTNQSPLLRLGL